MVSQVTRLPLEYQTPILSCIQIFNIQIVTVQWDLNNGHSNSSQLTVHYSNGVEVCFPDHHFPGIGSFPESGKFPVPSIREHPLPGPVSVLPFGTGQLLSRLSPKNETGIPEFEISGKFGKNSQNSVLDGKFPVGY